MSDLEVRLTQLGGDLDHPDDRALIDRVRTELAADPPARRSRRPRRRRTVVAVSLAVAATVTIAVTTLASRHAFDDGTRPTRPAASHGAAVHRSPPRTHTTTPTSAAPLTLADARSAVMFRLRIPTNTSPTAITIDPTVPGGAVTLDYPGYRLFELAAPPGPVSARFPDGGALITATTVRGRSGYWITGTHDVIEYRGHDGTVREHAGGAGHVLMWSEDRATITVTGPTSLPAAMDIAATLA